MNEVTCNEKFRIVLWIVTSFIEVESASVRS